MKHDGHLVQSNQWQLKQKGICNYKLEFLTHFLSPQLTQRSQWCFTFNGRKQPVKRLCFDFSTVKLLKKHKFSDSVPSFTKLFYYLLLSLLLSYHRSEQWRSDTTLCSPAFYSGCSFLVSIYSRNDAGDSCLTSQRRSWVIFQVRNWQENPIICKQWRSLDLWKQWILRVYCFTVEK